MGALFGVYGSVVIFGIEIRRSAYQNVGIILVVAGIILAATMFFYKPRIH